MWRFRFLLALFSLCLLAACAEPLESPPAAIIIFPGADTVSVSKHGSIWQARYWVNAPYPAQPVLRHIGEALAADGWKPLAEDFLNPGLPSSHVAGWSSFLDATVQPEREVHQWLAQWQSPHGEVIWYVLRYSFPERTPSRSDRLEVLVSFNPREIAEQQLQHVQRRAP
jgi:hypothetical protein